MGNIISLEDLEEEDDYEALKEDLEEGCNLYGSVQSLKVPRMKVWWKEDDDDNDGNDGNDGNNDYSYYEWILLGIGMDIHMLSRKH